MDDERPIRPAREVLQRAFAGEDVGRAYRQYEDGDDEEDDEYHRQDFEYAVLGLSPPEPGVDGGTAAAFAHDESLNELDASQLFERAAAREGAGGSGLGVEAVALVPFEAYGGPEGKECPVCISSIEAGQDFTALPCGHLFHHTCILRWFARESKCPYCRATVTKQTLSGGLSGD